MYEVESTNRRRAEREVLRLKRELNGSKTQESERVKEVCEYHAELWKRTYPRARGLTYQMDGKNAAAVRKVLRWGFSVDDIKQVLDGAFASDFHRSKPSYLYPSSVLGDENKIRNHLVRLEEQRAQQMLDEGLRRVRESLDPVIEEPIDRVLRALEAQDIPWTAGGWREPFVWLSPCPVCWGELRIEVDSRDWAVPRCQSCETLDVLNALWLEPADMARVEVQRVELRAAA